MALVVNRLTGELLPSVNTPDYPEEDWIINPDLSLVTKPAPFLVIEGDTVRDMTFEEQEAYLLAHPPQGNNRILDNGMTAYPYVPAGGLPISVDTSRAVFTTQTKGAKNFYLGIAGTDGAFVVPRNAVLTTVTIHTGAPVNVPVTVCLREAGSSVNLHTVELPAGETQAIVIDQSLLIDVGANLTCFLTCSKNVSNPIASFTMSWRN